MRGIDVETFCSKHQRCWVHKTANVLNKVPLPA